MSKLDRFVDALTGSSPPPWEADARDANALVRAAQDAKPGGGLWKGYLNITLAPRDASVWPRIRSRVIHGVRAAFPDQDITMCVREGSRTRVTWSNAPSGSGRELLHAQVSLPSLSTPPFNAWGGLVWRDSRGFRSTWLAGPEVLFGRDPTVGACVVSGGEDAMLAVSKQDLVLRPTVEGILLERRGRRRVSVTGANVGELGPGDTLLLDGPMRLLWHSRNGTFHIDILPLPVVRITLSDCVLDLLPLRVPQASSDPCPLPPCLRMDLTQARRGEVSVFRSSECGGLVSETIKKQASWDLEIPGTILHLEWL